MRKDYTTTLGSVRESESDFVERYWTEQWKKHAEPSTAADNLGRKPEYRVMKRYLRDLPGRARLLDAGCGLGDWTVFLSGLGHDTTGVDLSRRVISELTRRFPHLQFRAGDIRDLEFPEDSFDGVFSWGVFEHFEEGLQRCIGEAYRVLKPGGYLFVSVPYDNLRHALLAFFDRRATAQPESERTRFYQWRLTRGELRKELSMGGFEVLDLQPIHKRSGLGRCLHHEFRIRQGSFAWKSLVFLLSPLAPGNLIAHMLMGVARKPAGARGARSGARQRGK